MMLDFTNPVLQSYVTPFVVAGLTAGLIRFFFSAWRGSAYPTLAIGVGFIAAFMLANGLGLWPLRSLMGILPWVVLAGMAAGVLLDELNEPEWLVNIMSVGLPLGTGLWIGFEAFGDTLSITKTIVLAIAILIGFWVMRRMQADRESGLASPLAAVATLVGFAVAFGGSGSALARQSLALAAAIVGYAVWNWPKYRFPWGAAGSLSVGGGLMSIYAIWVVGHALTDAVPPTLALLSFLVFPVIERNLDLKPMAQPFVQVILALVPIGAAYAAMSLLG